MTNTWNTPVEALELAFSLRVRRYALRRGSGGAGARPGGESGQSGVNRMNGIPLPAKVSLRARASDRLVIESPGGGGWGPPAQAMVR